jgi:DNA-directed RNA polymerase
MLNMITTLLDTSSPVLLGAHNTFLKALLNRALAEKNQDSLRVFFAWYEDNMKRELNLTGDATTMALLLQGSLAVDITAISKRYVQQYVTFWKEHGREVKEIFALDMLSVDKVIEISRVCPPSHL